MKYGSFAARRAVLALLLMCTFGVARTLMADTSEQSASPATPQTETTTPGTQGTPVPATPQPQTPAKPGTDPASATAKPAPTNQAPKDDRIFFALPNLLTVENASNLPPLTIKQKFTTVAEGCFDPVEIAFIGIQAGLGQADNTDPTYHQGMLGYTKRFGTDYADAIIGNFGTGAIFPTLLHQDPRYYQRGKGNPFYRFGYAAVRVVVTRSDSSSKHEFNFSEFLGNGMAAALSNAYHPSPHTIASSTDVLGTQVLLDAIGYELKEFWPDIRRGITHKKH